MDSLSMDEDGGSPTDLNSKRKIISRRKKSADQIEVLERLYAENKYPSEEIRARMSAQLGLSEKQLQIWFTHRRHKDRKDGVEDVKLTFYAMRHKGAEGTLVDRVKETVKENEMKQSEMKYSKCPDRTTHAREDMHYNGGGYQSSLSPGDYRNGHGHIQYAYERGTDLTDSDSESSGLGEAEEYPSSALKSFSKRCTVVSRKNCPPQKRPVLTKPRVADQRDVELAAVAAVEAQLGEAIREDGPFLGMEFDQPPPDASVQLASSAVAALAPMVIPGRGGRY